MSKESGQKFFFCLQTSYLEQCLTDHSAELPLLFRLARQNSDSVLLKEHEKGALKASFLKTQGKDALPKIIFCKGHSTSANPPSPPKRLAIHTAGFPAFNL